MNYTFAREDAAAFEACPPMAKNHAKLDHHVRNASLGNSITSAYHNQSAKHMQIAQKNISILGWKTHGHLFYILTDVVLGCNR